MSIRSKYPFKKGGTGIRTQDNGFANRGLSPLGDAAALLNGFYNTIIINIRQDVFKLPKVLYMLLRFVVSSPVCKITKELFLKSVIVLGLDKPNK